MSKKYIIPALVGALTGAMVVTPVASQVQAAATATQNTVKVWGSDIAVSGIASKGEVGKPFNLGKVTVNGAGSATVKVYNPYNVEVFTNENANAEGAGEFTPAVRGYYTVVFAEKTSAENKDIKTKTKSYKVFIEGEEFSMENTENSKYAIPSLVSGKNDMYLPLPNILDAEGEVVKGEALNDFEITAKVAFSKSRVVDGDSISSVNLKKNDNEDFFKLDKKYLTENGTYRVVYELSSKTKSNTVYHRLPSIAFLVKNSFNEKEDIELDYEFVGSKPTASQFVIGEEVNLPKIKIRNKKVGAGNTNIEGYADIKVTFYDDEHKNGVDVSNQVKDFKFTPEKAGSYMFSYTAKAYYMGKTENGADNFALSSTTSSFKVDNVIDHTAPKPYVVNNFTFENGKFTSLNGNTNEDDLAFVNNKENSLKERNEKILEILGNKSNDVPSVVNMNNAEEVEVTLPAIFAADNYSEFDKLTLQLEYTQANVGGYQTVNIGADKLGKPITVKLEEGEYTFNYIAKDEAGKVSKYSPNETIVTYDVKVVKNLTDEEKANTPEVHFDFARRNVRNDEILEFKSATAEDKFNGKVYDSRVSVKTYYSLGAEFIELTKLNKNGNYEIDLNKTTAKELTVKVVAENDYSTNNTTVERKIQIIDVTDDVAPKIETALAAFKTAFNNANKYGTDPIVPEFDDNGLVDGKTFFNQTDKNIVKLPEFSVSDAKDANLQVTVNVLDPYGKSVALNKAIKVVNNGFGAEKYTYTVTGGEFDTQLHGIYSVTYTVKDAGNNMVSRSFGVVVGDTKAPNGIYPVTNTVFNEKQELGKRIYIPTAYIVDDNIAKPVDNTKTSWTVDGPGVDSKDADSFIPTIPGKYTIIYTGEDESGNSVTSSPMNIVVEDTLKPSIKFESEYAFPEVVEFDKATNSTTGVPVKLPAAYVKDEYTDSIFTDYTSLEVVVTDKHGNKVEVVTLKEEGPSLDPESQQNTNKMVRYQFVAKENGNYTVKYIARDGVESHITEIVKTVAVGDIEKPTLEWKNIEKDLIKTAKIGDQLSFSLNDLILSDNETSADRLKETADVYLEDANHNRVKDLLSEDKVNFRWDLEKEGTYTLNIVLQDDNGNRTQPFKYTIKVGGDKVKPSSISPVAGTVLIVVSVLVLAGVVIYFVATSKKGKSKRK